jgi:purine nucleosidase
LTPIIIDCDPGIDDALALLVAAGSREFEILGVTTVAGNRPLEVTSLNACRVLDAALREDVPVYSGCPRPLTHSAPRCNLVHGEDGLGGVTMPTRRSPAPAHATHFLVETLRDAPIGSITLVAVGPLTNLAVAEVMHPGILRRAQSLLVMGGAAFRPGNVTSSAEFNFYADALAAHIVMQSGIEVKLFGLDVTSKAKMSADWIASFDKLHTSCGAAVRGMLESYASLEPLLHDACPVACLLDPTLFSGEPCSVAVSWQHGPAEGHTTVWRGARKDKPFPPNAVVVTNVDCARLLALVRERIALLP